MDEQLAQRCPKCGARITLRLDIPLGGTFEYADIDERGYVHAEDGALADDPQIVLFCPCTVKRVDAAIWTVMSNGDDHD